MHGVKTVRKIIGGQTVTVIKSAVIMLIGIAPKGPKNELILVASDTDAAQFGKSLDNFTIPHALEVIRKQPGAGVVIVNNIYDPTANDLAVTNEAHVITARKIKTTYHPTTAVVVKNSGGTTTYVKDTDYTIDDFGNILIINNALANGTTLKANYSYFDTTTLAPEQIIGEIDSLTEVRTGLKLFDEAKTKFGFAGRILIAPGFSSINQIAIEMIAYVEQPTKKAITIIDAPSATTKADAIAGRGPAGEINFYTRSKRAWLWFPELKDFSGEGNAQLSPVSAYVAGVTAATDKNEGYWFSASNHLIAGPTGISMPITDDINDENSDANLLNAAGIATISTSDGIRTWGNRNASFFQETGNTAIDSFICVIRTADIIEDSIEVASRKYVDKPINQALLDDVREMVNTFFRVEKGTGALIDGICFYDPTINPPENLAQGKVKFSYRFLMSTPAEEIEYESFIDISLFSKIG